MAFVHLTASSFLPKQRAYEDCPTKAVLTFGFPLMLALFVGRFGIEEYVPDAVLEVHYRSLLALNQAVIVSSCTQVGVPDGLLPRP